MIPEALSSEEPTFLKIAPESKAPLKNNYPDKGPHYHADSEELLEHIRNGGNVGRVLKDNLVAFDVDSPKLAKVLDQELPAPYVIETGGSGFGEHRYYYCSSYQENQTEITSDGQNIGSLRSGHSYCLVPPSVHDETGNQYRVSGQSNVIAEVSESELRSVLRRFDSDPESTQHQRGGRAAGVGGSGPDADLPSEYPNRRSDWETRRKWLESNGLLRQLERPLTETARRTKDRSGKEFVLAKCLAEGGFHRDDIHATLDRLHWRWKWHEKGESYRKLTVTKAIEAAVEDPHVDFQTADMGASEASERRKTESGVPGPGSPKEVIQSMADQPDFTDKEAVVVQEGSDDGDSFKKVVRVEGNDNGETFDYVALKKGNVRERQTTDGETVLVEEVTDSASLGSPEYLDDLIEALEQLQNEIED